MKSIFLTFQEGQVNNSVPLPQAELIRGVAGSVFAVQVGSRLFTIDMSEVVKALSFEAPAEVLAEAVDKEEKSND